MFWPELNEPEVSIQDSLRIFYILGYIFQSYPRPVFRTYYQLVLHLYVYDQFILFSLSTILWFTYRVTENRQGIYNLVTDFSPGMISCLAE